MNDTDRVPSTDAVRGIRRLRHGLRVLRGADQGAAAVEMAASASVLFLMLIGTMKACLGIYTYHYISEAAREGTRYAIVRGVKCTTFTTACPASIDGTDVNTYVKSLSYPAIDTSKMTVSTSYSAYSGWCTQDLTSSSCESIGDVVTVKVQYAFPLTVPFLGSKTWNMSSTSAMIIAD